MTSQTSTTPPLRSNSVRRPYWDLAERVKSHDSRVYKLEKQKQGIVSADFSFVGVPSSGFVPGHRWYAEHDYQILDVRASCGGTAASALVTVILGTGAGESDLESVTFSGHTAYSVGLNTYMHGRNPIYDGDYLKVRFDNAGGADAWTIQVRLERLT